MRIIGHIEHPNLKITVFKMDNKLSVKFESGLYEQTYKFRTSSDLETLEDVKNLIDPAFMLAAENILKQMHQARIKALDRKNQTQKDEFPNII